MAKIAKSLITMILSGFIFLGCEESSVTGPEINKSEADTEFYTQDMAKNGLKTDDKEVKRIARGLTKRVTERQYKKLVFDFENGFYKGGTIHLQRGNGSNFHVYDNSFTPPQTHNLGDTVAIYMEVSRDISDNEMIFTFGPSGSQFYPAAKIKLDYSLLQEAPGGHAKLFYINHDGEYIEQQPKSINHGKKFMTIEVFHFSRYAVAYGD